MKDLERKLSKRLTGRLPEGAVVIVTPYGVGVRVVVVCQRSKKVVDTVANVTAQSLDQSPRDLLNGLAGAVVLDMQRRRDGCITTELDV